jgi:hypothetical protein
LDQATFTTSTLMPGGHTITAAYSGNATFASSGSNPVSVVIRSGVPIGPTVPTRTVLTARPRPANLGRRVTLTATVKDLKRGGSTPSGSVTFLDGTFSLGTFALRRGKASLKTSSLPLGPNTIHADYTPSQGFAPSTAFLVENVRARPSRSKAAPSVEIGSSGSVDDFVSGDRRAGTSRHRKPGLTPSVFPKLSMNHR